MGKCRGCGTKVSYGATTCPKCGIRRPVKKLSKILIGFLALVVLSFWAVVGNLAIKYVRTQAAATNETTATARTQPSSEPILQTAPGTVEIVRQTVVRDEFGGMVSTITIKNTNKFAIKDLRLVCSNHAASGTELTPTVGVIYEILRAGQTRTFRDVKLGYTEPDAKTYFCLVSTALPL